MQCYIDGDSRQRTEKLVIATLRQSMGPFDITSEEIKRLDDGQLRDVLRLVLESEVKHNAIADSAINSGGHLNAADGGVDARVEWNGEPPRTTWLPRTTSVFQSKAEAMPKSRLEAELAPGGNARLLFAELAQKGGAYIVFSTDDCSDSMYRNRLAAMRSAVAKVAGCERIYFDFYDAGRIARWVNLFPAVANFVRDQTGKTLTGWRPFENWSAPNLSSAAEYILDDRPKATFSRGCDDPVSIVDAICKVREWLKRPGTIVRLVGVSGVGKTRFAQALFDERIGLSPLSSGAVVYGDLGQSPATAASQVTEQLHHSRQNVVLIVDNCPGDTHRALTNVIRRPGGAVSLLTIDFDVGLDQPEATHVVRLHRNGDALIEALLVARVPSLSPLDRRRVAEFADGNARVALTIANHQGEYSSLADLSDRQLIDRLFLDGRRPTDDTLRRCAEVASLVWAFHVEAEGDQAPEHPALAELAEVSSGTMYGAIAEFVERGAAQKRGTQRAILPQALAVRLAVQALKRLPLDPVIAQFFKEGRERLFRSFTRRLGHLHQSEPAQRIAERFLNPDGALGDPTTLNDYGVALFENLAPAAPESALSAIERGTGGRRRQEFISIESPRRSRFLKLTRKLAYEATRFERAARVLLDFAKAEPEGYNRDTASEDFLELFWIRLSGTQALPGQRFGFLDELLANGDDVERQFAVRALGYALATGTRSSSHDGGFGARPIGGEWKPKSYAEQAEWFRHALRHLADIAKRGDELSKLAGESIVPEIRGLIRIGLIDDLEVALRSIRESRFWPEAWKHLCMAIHFDRKSWAPDTQLKVDGLEGVLRPISVEDRFTTYVTSDPWGLYSIGSESEEGGLQDTFGLAEAVGKEVGRMPDLWPSLVRQACTFRGSSNCHAFGRGLATRCTDIRELWSQLVSIFGEQEREARNAAVLSGFTYAASTRASDDVQNWLDEAVVDDTLGPYLVELSIYLPVDRRSIVRLTAAAHAGEVPIQAYGLLQSGRATKPTPPDALAEFLRVLAATGSEGAATAAQILSMYFFGIEDKQTIDTTLLAFGRDLLRLRDLYEDTSRNVGYQLAQIAKRCVAGRENEQATREICELLMDAVRSSYSKLSSVDELLRVLADLHPSVVLEVALATDDVADLVGEEIFGDTDDEPDSSRHSSLNENVTAIMDWVRVEPEIRAIRAARVVRYCRVDGQGLMAWTPVASELMGLAHAGIAALEEFHSRFHVGSGWEPWSSRFVQRRPLLETLTTHADPSIRSWAKNALGKLDTYIARLMNEERVRDERFE